MFSKPFVRSVALAPTAAPPGRVRLGPAIRHAFPAAFSTTVGNFSPPNVSSVVENSSPIAKALQGPSQIWRNKVNVKFDFSDEVFIVTGGAQGLGYTLAQGLLEAGAHVYCFDRREVPSQEFVDYQERVGTRYGGSMHYVQVDVSNAAVVDAAVVEIADKHRRLDGLVAAAAVQYVKPFLEYEPEKVGEMISVNFNGVFYSVQSCCRQMIRYGTPGRIVPVASMSAFVANKGLNCAVYNASKAAVVQLVRNVAMELSKAVPTKDGMQPIRINALCPGNIITPMVLQNFREDPTLQKKWEDGNMLGRISESHEYVAAVLYMLSHESSFMTGTSMTIDAGYTAW